MPEPSDSLHRLYDAEARVEVLPARGINVLTGAARAARRRALARSGLMGGAAAVVAGALVLAGVHVLGGPSTPAATPSATLDTPNPTLRVTWNPQAATATALAGFTVPACGDTFAPQPSTVDNVEAVVRASLDKTVTITGLEDELPLSIYPRVATVDGSVRDVLGSTAGYVVTRDDVVVAVGNDIAGNVGLMTAGGADLAGGGEVVPVFGRYSCAANAAVEQLYAQHGWDPLAEHGDAQAAQMATLEDAVRAQFGVWPSGTYKVYAITPILFGEQLAAAQQMRADGAYQVEWVRSEIGDSPYGNDPRLDPYCFDADQGRVCNAPESVIDDVLTFDVDATTVDGTPPGLAISAPAEVEVP